MLADERGYFMIDNEPIQFSFVTLQLRVQSAQVRRERRAP